MSDRLTAKDVAAAVRARFGAERDNLGPEWAALDEFKQVGPGYTRADLFLVRAWGGGPRGHERVLVEIKVSRSDLTHELARPQKLAALAVYAHRVFFATPVGLVRDTDDLGEGVGLIEVHGPAFTREVRKAARKDADPLPEGLVVEAFRRAARSEARIRNASDGDPAGQIVALQAELARAERAAQTARAAADRDFGRLREWLRVLGEAGGAPCVCGATLAPRKKYGRRVHADGSECPARFAEVDPDALAVRLGLLDDGMAA